MEINIEIKYYWKKLECSDFYDIFNDMFDARRDAWVVLRSLIYKSVKP